MKICTTVAECRIVRNTLKGSVAFVPTMGALHAGHLSLVEQARACADHVIVSIFVNARQFSARHDLDRYPRMLEADLEKLAPLKVDVVLAPAEEDLYQDGFSTTIRFPHPVSQPLCGATRPGHFDGVVTVLALLFNIVQPKVAVFGEKDWQQVQVVRAFIEELYWPVQMLTVATAREADGLAISSRNMFLDPAQRVIAPSLYKILSETAGLIRQQPEQTACFLAGAQTQMMQAGFAAIDYLECRNQDSLKPFAGGEAAGLRLFAAAFLGKTRLIDNIPV